MVVVVGGGMRETRSSRVGWRYEVCVHAPTTGAGSHMSMVAGKPFAWVSSHPARSISYLID